MNKTKVNCIFCGGDLYLESGQQLVKCAFCGETMAVTEFDSELARMNAAIEEGEQAKRALAAAEQEKEDAEKRLGQAMASLDGIFTSQKKADQVLAKISRDFSKEKETQKEMRELLTAVRGKVGGSQDMLSDLLKMVSKGQQDSGEKLASLQQLSEAILQNQGNMFGARASLSKITEKLDLNAQEQQKLAGDFMNWFQNLHKEDIQRLNAISSASSALLDGQKVLERKALQLQQAALDTQGKIDGFHQEYKHDKLEKLHALCQQAEQFQIDRQYDQAAERYLEVEANGGADAETCWRRILCHYCVFYQKNDDNEMVPIILNPDMSDPAQMSLRKELVSRLAPAGNEVRKHYENQLAEIDEILDQYRLVRHETEYDVFISVKQTDDQRHYTKDGDKASNLYDFLASRGLRVFNSRRSLPAGEIYEPRIISALMSAQVMIVVGSSAENMNSDWVKNEWTRFQWLQRREKDSKRKLLCYLTGGMDPYQIPRGLNPDRQAIIDGISAHDALINALKDLIKTGDAKSPGIGTAVPNPAESVLNQMTVWLVTGEYQQVAEKYEQLKAAGTFLDQSKLHLLALCAEKKVSDIEQLIQSSCILKEEPLFKAAFVMAGNMQERTVLTDYANRNDHYRDSRTAEAEKWFQQGEEAFKKKNSPLAASYYEKAAELGHVSAQFKLWNIYNSGQDGAGHDSIKAEYWLRKAAKQDHIPSIYYLTVILKRAGNKEAVYWAKKAAELGSAPVQGLLAGIYNEGKLVEKDEDQCRYWREKEASYIDPSVEMNEMSDLYQVRYNLAMDYQTGGRYGGPIDKDYERAAYWFGKAAEDTRTDNNSVRSKAFFELGKCYEEGIGVIKSSAAAIRNYEAAVNCATEADKKQGIDQKANERLIALRGKPAKNNTQSEEPKSVPEKAKNEQAQKKLSAEEWYQKHLTEDKAGNQAAAFECCMKAAQMGHAVAQNVVGWRYEVGKGTEKNDAEAFQWYKKAAENGNRIAQSNLGICYEFGRGVSKDLLQAVKWYRKAAENGWPKAQYKLGGFLEQGSVISMDIKEAAEWYRKAANQNYKGAAEKADELEGRIKRGKEIFDKYQKNDDDYVMFLEAMKSITEFKCQPVGVLCGKYSHAQFDILEQAVEKVRKEKDAAKQTAKKTSLPAKGGAELFRENLNREKQKSASIVIPYGTKVIPAKQYYKDETIKKVVIPDTVEEIGAEAFYGCTQLETVELSSGYSAASLRKISSHAFSWCKSLKKIELGNTIQRIEQGAFSYSGLEEISIGCKNCVIEKEAFRDCKNLKKITIANNPGLEINHAFYGEGGSKYFKEPQKVNLYDVVKIMKTTAPENIIVDFRGRTDFSKIDDGILRQKAGRCTNCGGKISVFGKCKNCGMKRL